MVHSYHVVIYFWKTQHQRPIDRYFSGYQVLQLLWSKPLFSLSSTKVDEVKRTPRYSHGPMGPILVPFTITSAAARCQNAAASFLTDNLGCINNDDEHTLSFATAKSNLVANFLAFGIRAFFIECGFKGSARGQEASCVSRSFDVCASRFGAWVVCQGLDVSFGLLDVVLDCADPRVGVIYSLIELLVHHWCDRESKSSLQEHESIGS